MDKELEKKQKKKEKLFARMEEIKPEQINLVRFVDVRWEVMEQDDEGKWHRTGREHSHGLQIENRFYPVKGPYKMVNRKTFRITKSYSDIPEWATEELKAMYKREWESRGLDKRQKPPIITAPAPPAKTSDSKLSTRAMELLVTMQFSPNQEHSIGSLKTYTHSDHGTIYRCIRELESAGYLVKKQYGQGKRKKTIYTLSANQQPPLSVDIGQATNQDDDLPPW